MANKILKLLIGMDKQISNVERAQTEFLCETVLPVAKVASCKGNLSDIYRCLTNSSEYKDMALHLMIFLLESVSCPRYDELLPFIKSRITARIPKLALRILLMGIANNLGEDAEDFIRFAASELQLNPQIFFTDDANHCVGLLELFKRALKQRVISTNDLSKLKDWLKSIENNDEDVWEIFEKYDETLHLPSELPGEREPAHARLRSLSGPESVHSGTPPQGESGSMMQQGISVGSQQFREENIHTASSQFPRAHPDHVTRSSASSSTAVIPGREDTPFLNPNQQPITHDVPMKPRAEAQDSGSETDNEGHKQSEKQYSVEEEEPTAGQSEHVYIRSQSDTGANSESKIMRRN